MRAWPRNEDWRGEEKQRARINASHSNRARLMSDGAEFHWRTFVAGKLQRSERERECRAARDHVAMTHFRPNRRVI